MSNLAFVKADLSQVLFVTESTEQSWSAPEPGEEVSARSLRLRAQDGASWIMSQPGLRKRLSAAILDVDDALCAWVKAPSDARPVLSAAVRNLMQEWGDEHIADSVEPLSSREKKDDSVASRSPLMRRLRSLSGPSNAAANEPDDEVPSGLEHRGTAMAVIALPDALTRLWLDALDRRSVKVGRVMTLWHALGVAWNDAPPESTTAVMLIDEQRLVWSWVAGHDLLAAGAVELGRGRAGQGDEEQTADTKNDRQAACKRMALDWLTWASQLGTTPERVVIVGQDCRAWSEALAGQWSDIDVRSIEQVRPVAATVAAIAEGSIDAGPDTARRCLEGLTHRPTRSLRARYRLAGAAMLLLLVAVSSVAFRLSQKAEDWRVEAIQIRNEAKQIVRGASPEFESANIRDPGRMAQQLVQGWLEQDDIVMPPKPRPILQELVRLTGILSKPESGIMVLKIELDHDRNNELRYAVPDRQQAAEILQQLGSAPDRLIDWRRRPRDPDPLKPILTGDWILK